MASNNLLPLTDGYTNFANITRTYPMGAGAVTFTVTTAGSAYTVGNISQLVYVSGGAGAPNPNGAPFIQISTVNGTNGITAVSILTNGAGDGISVGQIFQVTGGSGRARLTVASIVPWNAVDKPWYRIKLRTIPEDQSKLQIDPDDEELALELLQKQVLIIAILAIQFIAAIHAHQMYKTTLLVTHAVSRQLQLIMQLVLQGHHRTRLFHRL